MFPAGVTNAPLNILINDDNILEDDENFTVTINSSSLPSGVTVGDPGEATVTIKDNDGKYIIKIFINETKVKFP